MFKVNRVFFLLSGTVLIIGLERLPAQAETTDAVKGDSISTNANALGSEAIEVSSESPELDQPSPTTVAQDIDEVSPGRTTRSSSSYIGIGGNIGLGEGDTELGESSFAVFSKVGLTNYLSVRPSVLVGDDPTILLPVTVDFNPGATGVTEDVSEDIDLRVAPYLGAGAAISTSEEGAVDFLATGGVDIPLSSRFTANAAVNATLFDNAAVGLTLGVGYNF